MEEFEEERETRKARPQTAKAGRKTQGDLPVEIQGLEVRGGGEDRSAPRPKRPQSAGATKLYPSAQEALEQLHSSENPHRDWQRLFQSRSSGRYPPHRLLSFNSTQLGSRLMNGNYSGRASAQTSRPASARVALRTTKFDPPHELSQGAKRRVKPRVNLNGSYLLQAMALAAPYTSGLKSDLSSFSQRELISIAKSKSIETFFRVVTGKSEPRQRNKGKPPLAKPWYQNMKRSSTSLLDGTPYCRVSHPRRTRS